MDGILQLLESACEETSRRQASSFGCGENDSTQERCVYVVVASPAQPTIWGKGDMYCHWYPYIIRVLGVFSCALDASDYGAGYNDTLTAHRYRSWYRNCVHVPLRALDGSESQFIREIEYALFACYRNARLCNCDLCAPPKVVARRRSLHMSVLEVTFNRLSSPPLQQRKRIDWAYALQEHSAEDIVNVVNSSRTCRVAPVAAHPLLECTPKAQRAHASTTTQNNRNICLTVSPFISLRNTKLPMPV